MDVRFDRLSKFLSTAISRRDSLQTWATVGLGAALGGLAPNEAPARKRKKKSHKPNCKHGKRRCGNDCVNRATDKGHCGRCGNRCQGELTCAGGACRCQQDACLVSRMDIAGVLPMSIAVLPTGDLAVGTDFRDIATLSPSGEILSRFGGPGTGPGQFGNIPGVATDAAGNIYVADPSNLRVQKISPGGRVDVWSLAAGPQSVAATPSGIVYALDGSSVHRLSADGRPEFSWGPGVTGSARFDFPVSIAADGAGAVYVLDRIVNLLYRFTDNGGRDVRQDWVIGGSGDGPGQFDFPATITADRERVYLADRDNNRIQAFRAADGQFLFDWRAEQSGRPWFPNLLATDREGRFFIETGLSIYIGELGTG